MIEEISYQGWERNLRLSGAATELILTLEVGPRIMRYGFIGAANTFTEIAAHCGGRGEAEFMMRGGHRFWTAPEDGHSYSPDNVAVAWKKIGADAVECIQPVDAVHGFQKTLRVEMLAGETIRVTHILIAAGKRPLEYVPWALSAMKPGGTAIIPQPALDVHPSEFPEGRAARPEEFLPNRELVLWPFTNLADGRYIFTEHFLRVSTHPSLRATKLGLKLPAGWVAYQRDGFVFAKHFGLAPARAYPDRGVNFELYTDKNILELESLAPLAVLQPGESSSHVEHWVLRRPGTDLHDEKAALDFFAGLPVIG